MAQIIDFETERGHRAKDQSLLLEKYDRLPCPTCERETAPFAVSADHVVSYRCQGPGHRPRAWRINEHGELMPGLKGKRVL